MSITALLISSHSGWVILARSRVNVLSWLAIPRNHLNSETVVKEHIFLSLDLR